MKRLKVEIEGIEDGMMAAEDIRTSNGTVIIKEDTELEDKHMNLLKAAGVQEIEVYTLGEQPKMSVKIHVDLFPGKHEVLKAARIMIVDDSKLMRLKLKKIVEEAGLNLIGQAENGLEAVEMAKSLNPTFITMDIEMPEMNGISAVQEIHKIMPDVKIVMISSLGQEDQIIESITAGAIDFIHKPFDPEKVKKAIINGIIKEFPSL